MSILIPSNFEVSNDCCILKCLGISQFYNERPYAWYIGDENGFFLIWIIRMKDNLCRMVKNLIEGLKRDPSFSGQEGSALRSSVFMHIFQNHLKVPLQKFSISDELMYKTGGEDAFKKYFSRGISIALKNILGDGIAWFMPGDPFRAGEDIPSYMIKK